MSNNIKLTLIFVSTLVISTILLFSNLNFVNLNNYLTYEITGVNNEGEIKLNFDEKTLKNDLVSSSNILSFINKKESLISFKASQTSDLSNGDVVTITSDFDHDFYKDTYGVNLYFKPIDVSIEGLENGFVSIDSLSSTDIENLKVAGKPTNNEQAIYYQMFADFDNDIMYVVYFDDINYYVTALSNFKFDEEKISHFAAGISKLYSIEEYEQLDKSMLEEIK